MVSPRQYKGGARPQAVERMAFAGATGAVRREQLFEVIGCHSGKRYRICHGNGANIVELDDRARPTTGWCFVPNEHLVAGDVMLAQKIALETDERGALAKANKFAPK